ncbi:ADP-ribosylglycohydrolase [Hamadaea flava]|uniref:ADP-ribosylglycohydrolase family protein n=1 Tax=Hamadaea flava TaxID=1742688 RepID=A0ABV8LUN6_9ACTN|nr:ADP-ribosylglycohydrolase family protein [Hamadaea flava]MCP2327422.1 ADP-ribosylglycohydrolase [Hamadaea flava]
MRLSWVQPEDLLSHELVTARDLGKDVSKVTWRWLDAGGSLTAGSSGASATPATPELHALAEKLMAALDEQPMPVRPGEPDDFAGVKALWRNVPRQQPRHDLERLHAAWVGRAAGCVLGKPVEKIPREGIREILQSSGQWPLTGYIAGDSVPDEVTRRWPWNRRSAPTSLAEPLAAGVSDGMPEDDDLNYTLIALRLVERCGPGFTADDVAQAWLDELPGGRVFTAERIAYRNLLLGHTPPETALRGNPFREWIGAQIRTDLYGWIHPGRPDLAAECAYRDASVSHVRAGIYGAMWVAAMSSAALTADNIDDVLDAGESVVPPVSRFANAIMDGRDLATRGDSWEGVVDEIYARYGKRHWVHVLPNAALVAAALEYHGGDFAASVCAVVSAGCDTDSNGATVGAITAALAGAVPDHWAAPLRDTLRTSIPGSDKVTFTELAERTMKVST